MAVPVSHRLPITLPFKPSCNNCLAWSVDDEIAVAGGEIIAILHPKNSPKANPEQKQRQQQQKHQNRKSKLEANQNQHTTAGVHPQWHIENVRVNSFRYAGEWPEQHLATIRDFSIGEEQSNSTVVALAWSSDGLGMHRRPVLGVLTSNLILSFWETDGEEGHYRRTAVVNDYMMPKETVDLTAATSMGAAHDDAGVMEEQQQQQQQQSKSENHRRIKRVRSFAWLPALKHSHANKWGDQYLIIANDQAELIILQVSKTTKARFGNWNLEICLRTPIDQLKQSAIFYMSPLQFRLDQQTTITAIEPSVWASEDSTDTHGATILGEKTWHCLVQIRGGTRAQNLTISATIPEDGQISTFSYSEHSKNSRGDKGVKTNLHADSAGNENSTSIHNPKYLLSTYFEERFQPILQDFDTSHQLHGYCKTRFWGAQLSPDSNEAVGCFTVHPSDMVEYTIPSTERCTLVFQPTNMERSLKEPIETTPESVVMEKILRFVYNHLELDHNNSERFDRRLIQIYIKLANIVLQPDSTLSVLYRDLRTEQEMRQTHGEAEEHNGIDGSDMEGCEVCGASVPFTSETKQGICRSEHQFSRCRLTFLAIQEPGISKYCSRCSAQFLDLMKLGPPGDLSLASSVFEAFDVCPYCQGKFRG